MLDAEADRPKLILQSKQIKSDLKANSDKKFNQMVNFVFKKSDSLPVTPLKKIKF